MNHSSVRTLALFLLVLSLACSSRAKSPPKRGFQYPAARTVDQVDRFGETEVADPYRWMEEDSDELRAWIKAENELTLGWLRKGSDRRRIRERLEKLWNYEKYSIPRVEGGKYVYRRNSGLENQAPLYIADSLDAEPRVLLDPNTLSADGTVALSETFFSPDASLMAYSIASGGSDRKEVRVRDVRSGDDLPSDVLTDIKFSGVSWNAEGSGFYYTRMARPEAGQEMKAADSAPRIHYHSVGTGQAEDVHARGPGPEREQREDRARPPDEPAPRSTAVERADRAVLSQLARAVHATNLSRRRALQPSSTSTRISSANR